MRHFTRCTGIVVLSAFGLAFAQAAETSRQERMDDAYRNWQSTQGGTQGGATAAERGVSGRATPDDGHRPGWTTGSPKGDLKATGEAVKDAARDTGAAVAEGGRKVGAAAKAAGRKASEALSR